ncbi:transcription elongation factor [Xylariaceae sp. FL0255]|nr:transcription elongation factor [Xylariaceae sp. FL0255]
MGKRKKSSRKPQGPKKREPLAKEFTCLFCNHDKSVTVKLNKKLGVGELSCAVCGQSFQCGIHSLMDAIDVYSEWVDAAGTLKPPLSPKSIIYKYTHVEAVAEKIHADAVAKEAGQERGTTSSARPRAPAVDREVEDEEDEHRYEGEGIVGDDEDD